MNIPVLFAAAIMAVSANPQPAVPACVTLNRALSLYSTGADVSRLQAFLGVRQTGYFGAITRNALIVWQIRAHVVSSSAAQGAGTTGPLTRALLACPISGTAPSRTQGSIVPHTSTSSTRSTARDVPSTTPATSQLPVITIEQYPSAGSGAVVSSCRPFTTPKPPASECATGEWILINDEADCPVQWDCQDPNAMQ